ncbi:MAG TPA: biotin--[acetyl-CoA-carboxylase] ligase [Chitinophagaceae bacterium]|nr:biotin--[acetyl-CoA-carboxylase] ligase [Chitinophagaceae bacterium]
MPLPSPGYSVGSPFIELQSVDSTNNYALAQIHANLAQPGSCYFAHEQTAGKGRRGKSWATEKDANITMSVVLKPSFLRLFQQFHLSACVAVATHTFLKKFASQSIKIKWPNDLYWENRKIAGILIENVIGNRRIKAADWEWAVVGIGVNVNQTEFPSSIKNAASLKQISGKHLDTISLAKELCQFLDSFYLKLLNDGVSQILDQYNEVLYKKNEIVKFKKVNRLFNATVKNVNEAGELIVQHGLEERFDFGELEWMM